MSSRLAGSEVSVCPIKPKLLSVGVRASRRLPFYESPEDLERREAFLLNLDFGEEWLVSVVSPWTYRFPVGSLESLPQAGWKIHLSTIPAQAIELLSRAARICLKTRTPFKHLTGFKELFLASQKYTPRAASGKFITIYPRDDTEFLSLLNILEDETSDFSGPYILSDTKYRCGPVYYRYGGFVPTPFLSSGRRTYGLVAPTGELLEDSRKPYAVVPDFVEVPESIKESVYRRLSPNSETAKTVLFPYIVEKALHFSSSGGVYLAHHADDSSQKYVIKEARKYTGYSSFDISATDRLENEAKMLKSLSGKVKVPRFYEFRHVEEHRYLVQGYVAGSTLQKWIAKEFPFSLDQADISAYSAKAAVVGAGIIDLVHKIHDLGYALMDIQPNNFVVSPDLEVTLIDLEAVGRLDEDNRYAIGTPGYVPIKPTTNMMRDQYALCMLLLYIFWPSLASGFSTATVHARVARIKEHYPGSVYKMIEPEIAAGTEPILDGLRWSFYQDPSRSSHQILKKDLISGIQASREANQDGRRLYPGDAVQFTVPGGTINVETGACGVALTLHRVGLNVDLDISWIVEKLKFVAMPFDGLLRGLSGVASALCEMGDFGAADSILMRQRRVLRSSGMNPTDFSVRSGICGSVLSLISALKNGSRTAEVLLGEYSDTLRYHLKNHHDQLPYSASGETGNPVGLFDGPAGVSLTCVALANLSGDSWWLDYAELFMERELSRLSETSDGKLQVRYSDVAFSYLAEGAAGIYYALLTLLRFRDLNPDLNHKIAGVRQNCLSLISLNGGLFHGLAGFAAALSSTIGEEREFCVRYASRQLDRVFDEFTLRHRSYSGLFMIGDHGLRLSADYSTGAAGVIAATLSTADTGQDRWFPAKLWD